MESVIVVVNRAGAASENLKELIQFMDAPNVCTATPTEWHKRVGDNRLEAVFVGPDISDDDIRHLIDSIGSIDPNVPIVMIAENHDA